MGFRKDKEESLEWHRWLARCRSQLVACGLPEEVYESQQEWWYFLDHGSLSTRKQIHWFSLDKLSRQQLQGLGNFLEGEHGSEEYPPLVLTIVRSEVRPNT